MSEIPFNKPFIVGEAGMNDYAKHPAGHEKIDTFE